MEPDKKERGGLEAEEDCDELEELLLVELLDPS